MKVSFVDTNLFIRYLTNDDKHKADRVEKLLDQAAAGKIQLVTADLIIAEIIWVLESAYGLSRNEIAPMIKAIVATPGLEVIGRHLLVEALDYYVSYNIDFIDGYIASRMKHRGIKNVYSFDKKHISRIPGIKRIEP